MNQWTLQEEVIIWGSGSNMALPTSTTEIYARLYFIFIASNLKHAISPSFYLCNPSFQKHLEDKNLSRFLEAEGVKRIPAPIAKWFMLVFIWSGNLLHLSNVYWSFFCILFSITFLWKTVICAHIWAFDVLVFSVKMMNLINLQVWQNADWLDLRNHLFVQKLIVFLHLMVLMLLMDCRVWVVRLCLISRTCDTDRKCYTVFGLKLRLILLQI